MTMLNCIKSCIRNPFGTSRLLPYLKGGWLLLVVWLCGIYSGYLFSSEYLYVKPLPTKLIAENVPGARGPGVKNRSNPASSNGSGASTVNKNMTSPTVHVTQMRNGTEPFKKSNSTCVFPTLDPSYLAIQHLTVKYPPLDCSKGVPNVAYLDGKVIRLNHLKVGKVLTNGSRFNSCRYASLARLDGSDFDTKVVRTSPPFNSSITLEDDDENVVVECFNNKSAVISRSYLTTIRERNATETRLRENYRRHVTEHSPSETLSILLIGMDGISKQNSHRSMPLTRNFLLQNLKAIELHKFNKLGDNTFPNVVPLLAGKHEWELSYFDKWNYSAHFDGVNHVFLWSDFQKAGYRTAMALDMSKITAFHFLKKGWLQSPVEYYHRPLVIKSVSDTLMRNQGGYCLGDTPDVVWFHDFWLQLASVFNNSKTKPYFGYSFAARLTHDDPDLTSAGDKHYMQFLKTLTERRVLNNTVLIFFSDHGPRFGPIRPTYNGIIESRTPYVFLVFPPWFFQKYTHLHSVLKINQHRLTSNFDLYETMRDLLYFHGKSGIGDRKHRGISLFKEIPEDRTCKDIDVPILFCVCKRLEHVNLTANLSQHLASTLMGEVTKKTTQHRSRCALLRLSSIISVLEVILDSSETRNPSVAERLYQVTVKTVPGEAVYEAIMEYHRVNETAKVLGEIGRLNMYAGQADCVMGVHLKVFCYCERIKSPKGAI